MKATRVLLHFMMVSIAAYGTLHYFGFAYESLLLFTADRFVQTLSVGARLIHDSSHQLCVVMFLPGGPVQVKLAGFDWIYASQATAVGVVLSTYTSPGRKAFALTLICGMLALVHTALLVLAVAEISKQINGANSDIAAFGTMAFKLYRLALPALLAGTWIICSREALFIISGVRHLMPVSQRHKTTPTLRWLWDCRKRRHSTRTTLSRPKRPITRMPRRQHTGKI